jgi:predicted transcriptional regulator
MIEDRMKSVSIDAKYWMIQKIVESKRDDILNRVLSILVEDASVEERFSLMTASQRTILDEEIKAAESDIANGRVHSHEAIGEWIESL